MLTMLLPILFLWSKKLKLIRWVNNRTFKANWSGYLRVCKRNRIIIIIKFLIIRKNVKYEFIWESFKRLGKFRRALEENGGLYYFIKDLGCFSISLILER